jgi:ABC-2 type transport system ATP-binding protein
MPRASSAFRSTMSFTGVLSTNGPYRSLFGGKQEAMQTPAIECDGLVHSFGARPVLRGVSFCVPQGSIYGFIGPNGAGKTTTLRILATLLEPTAGTARIAGNDVATHPERVRRIVGYMPDSAGVPERVTVGEYLDFFASAHGIHREHRARAVKRALDLTEIGFLRMVHASTLSKGQKQRLLLARTLLHDPEVLVLDEPASDLDPRARIELRTLLAMLGRMGKTILLSSHILTELAELCDAIGVLEEGRIVVSGALEEVRALVRPGRRLRLRVLTRNDEAVALLRASPSVRSVVTADSERAGATTLEITHEGDDWTVAELVNALTQAQIALGAVEPERADLEQIFMDVTNQTSQGGSIAPTSPAGAKGTIR